MKIEIDRKLGLCKVCDCFYKCKPSDFSITKYCSRRCQLRDYSLFNRKASLIGKTFGVLYVLIPDGKRDKRGNITWQCQCRCGKICIVAATDLKRGRKKSCGCLRKV